VVRVKILEIDSERRRLSLSVKRVEGQVLPVRHAEAGDEQTPDAEGAPDLEDVPELGLSEDVFGGDEPPAQAEEPAPGDEGGAAPQPDAAEGDGTGAPAEAEERAGS
jgi:small subunit ribosomal protein S1